MHEFAVRFRRHIAEIAAALRSDLVLYVCALVYLLAGGAYVLAAHRPLFGAYDVYASGCVVLCCIVLPYIVLLIGAARIALRNRGRPSLAWRTLIAPRRIGRFVAGTLLMLVVLLFVEATYTSVKTANSSGGFPYDSLAADIDKAIHFGHAPAYWLAFLRHDWLLHIVETNYEMVWMVFWLGTLYWVAISPRAETLRVRFCLTFMLAWILIGNVVAGLFSTAGPALYGLSTGDGQRFAKLRAFLDSTKNATASTQHYLWALHTAGESNLGSGISAFPSMHVAITTLCAVFLTEVDRRLGLAAWAYVAIIMLSSVYLGWHYAIDGYASVLLVLAIYWAVGRVVPMHGKLRLLRPALWRPSPASQIAAGPDASPP